MTGIPGEKGSPGIRPVHPGDIAPRLSAPVLLVSDLDGTLLRPDGTLSAGTIETLNEYIAAGGWFTYATARSYHSAGVLPLIFTVRAGRDRVCWVPTRMTPGVESFVAARRGDPRLLPVRQWTDVDPGQVFYVSLIGPRDSLEQVLAELPVAGARCHHVLSEDAYTPGEWWLELTALDATKATAVGALAAGCGARSLVCFGDNRNDLPMFALAEVALAVANAVPDVRAAATAVIGSNAEDGVAAWVKRFRTG
ncbi:HAD family hydrolase [Actinoplanes sp. RD1]|uniref:HAD family hydrolase n=1 Tax=Actinoplanes sp. RD1 TaxID=3064538 RepID=UPI002741C8D3|nr:HAD hydrolase family protein [Actinoplanes sp. RD1]